MKDIKKGKRIQYLQSVINGDVKRKSFGWTPEKVERKDGDVWTDANGIEWEMRDGVKWKTTKLLDALKESVSDYLTPPPFCPVCNRGMTKRLDKKMWLHNKQCFDCTIDMEHKMRIEGTYEAYEQSKIQANKEAWFIDFKQMIDELKTETIKNKFVDGNGEIEDFWEDPQNFQELSALIDPIMEDIELKIFGKRITNTEELIRDGNNEQNK